MFDDMFNEVSISTTEFEVATDTRLTVIGLNGNITLQFQTGDKVLEMTGTREAVTNLIRNCGAVLRMTRRGEAGLES